MKHYLVIINGSIAYSSWAERPPEAPPDGMAIEMPEGFAIGELHKYYFKDDEIRFKGEGGQFEVFDLISEAWILDIDQLKAHKAKIIELDCRAAIYAGYSSTALGQVHHYPTNDKDQVNMNGSFSESLSPENPPDWTTKFWCQDATDDWQYRVHTAVQIRKAGSDMKAHITAQILKNAGLQNDILAATTKEEIDAITW